MKIAILTLCINDWYEEIVKYGVKSIENYAKMHKYDFYVCNDVYESEGGTRDYPWYKILAIQKILPKYDVICWIDADGFVMLPEKKVEDFMSQYMKPHQDLLCVKDWNSTLNTGLMIIKNTPFIHTLLYETWNNKEPFDANFHEQASMGDLYTRNVFNSKEKMVILPLEKQHVFFSYWSNYYPNKQFFMHIARCAHDPCGFVYTLDCYCPIKMDEDVEGEYEERLKWLNDPVQCRLDIESWMKHGARTRESTRSKLYREKFKNEKLDDKIKNTKLKKNL